MNLELNWLKRYFQKTDWVNSLYAVDYIKFLKLPFNLKDYLKAANEIEISYSNDG